MSSSTTRSGEPALPRLSKATATSSLRPSISEALGKVKLPLAAAVVVPTTLPLRIRRTSTNGSAVPLTAIGLALTIVVTAGVVMAGAGGGVGSTTTLRSSVAKFPAVSRASNFTRCTAALKFRTSNHCEKLPPALVAWPTLST